MADIYHTFRINAPASEVFEAIGSADVVSAWWALTAAGTPGLGEIYDLNFGPGYLWQAEVTIYEPDKRFEWQMIDAQSEWMNTRVGFSLEADEKGTVASFYHTGWPDENDHFKTSSYCWAMYLRIMKRHIECDEFVPYDERLSV
jgi:uncharacterized protein YndB with AHSA1/START domain